MKIRNVMPFTIALVAMLFLVACNEYIGGEEGGIMELQDKGERNAMSNYIWGFELRDDIRNMSWIHATHEETRDNFSRLVLVLSPEERKNFPEDVLVLWPSECTYRLLDVLNYGIVRNEIDLSRFSLEYPITIENIVYDWDKVYELWIIVFGGGW
jgi:hypothetical protein